jgi:hypothetical protein
MSTYWKVGTTWNDYFVYPESGLADGSWTKEVSKNGANLATTMTVANVAADTRYYTSASGSTDFPAATGIYQVVVYKTTLPNDKRTTTLVVNSNGAPSGTIGTVSFTPTANDGRITDGTDPLEGATVTIRRPNGDVYTQVESDSSGLWETVYFDATGTFTAVVEASGYSQGSFSITVTALTATGPGADIELTAISVGSGITLSALAAYARRMFVDRQGAQANTVITEAVNEALAHICSQHNWTWLYTVGRVTLRPAYTTGTVAVVEGDNTVTLTGGVFPSWAADADILIGGVWTPIASRTDDTHIEMASPWAGDDDSATEMVVAQYRYDLPDDCRNLINVVQVPQWIWGTQPIGRFELEQMRVINAGVTPVYAIQKNQICIWPYISGDTTQPVNILYLRMPATLSSGPQEADWDPLQLELLHRSIDFQIACRGSCVAGDKEKCFKALQDQISISVGNERTGARQNFTFGGGGYRSYIPSTGNRFTT